MNESQFWGKASVTSGGLKIPPDSSFDFLAKALSLQVGIVKDLKMVEMLNNFVVHHHQLSFTNNIS